MSRAKHTVSRLTYLLQLEQHVCVVTPCCAVLPYCTKLCYMCFMPFTQPVLRAHLGEGYARSCTDAQLKTRLVLTHGASKDTTKC